MDHLINYSPSLLCSQTVPEAVGGMDIRLGNLSLITKMTESEDVCHGTIAQSVEHPSKAPVWCNSTDVGLNHAAA